MIDCKQLTEIELGILLFAVLEARTRILESLTNDHEYRQYEAVFDELQMRLEKEAQHRDCGE